MYSVSIDRDGAQKYYKVAGKFYKITLPTDERALSSTEFERTLGPSLWTYN